jgi:hypothetical protein
VSDFRAILLEGVFYLSDEPYPDSKGILRPGFNDLLVQPDQGPPGSIYAAIRPFLDGRVQIAVHQLPNMPPDLTRWGGGSCLWMGAGLCPFGHHKEPFRLFNVSGDGFLRYDLDHGRSEGGWWLDRPDGAREILPLAMAMAGHRGRVAVATAMTVEQMRDAVMSSGDLNSVEALGRRAEDLRDLVAGLSKIAGGKSG